MPSSAHKEPVLTAPETNAPPVQPAARLHLSLELALDLVLCGGLTVGLSVLAQHLQPDLHRATLITGLAGGGLCVLWGVLGRRGMRCRGGTVVTLAAVACVFMRQVVQSWEASAEGESKARVVTALMTVLVVFSVGMLAKLARERKRPPP